MGHSDHHVRRVVLPSGKTIEVVYFDDVSTEDSQLDADTTTEQTVADLHMCGTCGSDLVYPTDWWEAGSRHWRVELRCPNCEWVGAGVYEQEVVDRFDRALDRGTDTLTQDLNRLMRANAEQEIKRFREALAHDLIVPEDF